MSDMKEFFQRSRAYVPRKDTQALELEIEQLAGSKAKQGLLDTYSSIDTMAPEYVCADNSRKRQIEHQIIVLGKAFLDSIGITNGRRVLYQARMFAHFQRKVAEARDKSRE